MKAATIIRVRGTQYYPTNELIQRGMLVPGESVQLEPEPHNPYDKNAVLVRLMRTGDKIGHLSKEIASRYLQMLVSGTITSAVVVAVESGRYPDVSVKIFYRNDKTPSSRGEINPLRQSACDLPKVIGVYALTNVLTGRVYIGSSSNIADRALHHCAELESGRHPNQLLCDDFEKYSGSAFQFSLVTRSVSINVAREDEKRTIEKIWAAGGDLYNMTPDGAGKKPTPGFSAEQASISDRRPPAPQYVKSRMGDRNGLSQTGGARIVWWIVGVVLVLLLARC